MSALQLIKVDKLNKVPHIVRTKESKVFIPKERSEKEILSLSQLEALEDTWIKESQRLSNIVNDRNNNSSHDRVSIFENDLG